MKETEVVLYDKIMYDDCFIEILMNVVTTFRKPTDIFFASELSSYVENLNRNEFFYTNKSLYSITIETMLEKLAIKMHPKFEIEGAVENIKLCIDKRQLVIAKIDQYYYPESLFYLKEHSVYHILIFDYYDDEFGIVALHRGRCVKLRINYLDFKHALEMLNRQNNNFVYASYEIDEKKNKYIDHRKSYIAFLEEKKEVLYQNLEVILDAADYYEGDVKVPDSLFSTYVNPIAHIVLIKNVILYKLELLNFPVEIVKINREIISEYKKLFTIIGRDFRKEKICTSKWSVQVRKIFDLEKLYLDKLFISIEESND